MLPDDRRFVLVVTDEEPTPSGAVEGSVEDLASLVAECPFFEYLITDHEATFGVFDTHHNTLVRLGELPL